MALRGKQPDAVEKRMKAMFFGNAGAGKTTCSLSFPKPYLIDTERGAENDQYLELLRVQEGVIYQTTDFDDAVAEVLSLLTEKHDYRTLIIDPITNIYNDLLEKAELKVGTEFGRHYGEANKHMRHLMNLLLRLDMNVIVTCHSKKEYGDNLAVLGHTFDGWKKLDYLFDLVFEIQKRGNDRVGRVVKTRVEGFPEGEVFPWTYDDIAQRYGGDILKRAAVPQKIAGPELAEEMVALMDKCNVTPEVRAKILKKHKADDFAELPADVAKKAIKHYSLSADNIKKGAA